MNLKKKLAFSIIAVCLLVSTLIVGIFALTTSTYQLGGTVTFVARGINANITNAAINNCKFKEAEEENTIIEGKLTDIIIDMDMDDTEVDPQLIPWTDLILQFLKSGEPATLTFNIKNTTKIVNELLVISVGEITSGEDSKNVVVDVEVGEELIATTDPEKTTTIEKLELEQNADVDVTITFSIVNTAINARLKSFVIPFALETDLKEAQ